MRKLYSNGLTALLIMAIVFWCLPMATFAEEQATPAEPTEQTETPDVNLETQGTYGDFTYDIVSDGVRITGYNGSGGSVTIPNSINGYPVAVIGEKAFEYCNELTSITIPGNVIRIGYYAFYYCNNLQSVTLNNGLKALDGYVFVHCTNLKKITLPATLNSVGSCVFNRCTGLESVTIQSGVSELGYHMFYGCTKLRSISIPGSVKTIPSSCFYGCTSLTSVTIENGVQEINEKAFNECTGLTNIDIPGSVTSIGKYAFASCDHLKDVKMAYGVQNIDDVAFSSCQSLSAVYIPASVTEIGKLVFADSGSVTIYGNSGCYAQQYAKANNIPFVVADGQKNIQLNTVPTKLEYLAGKDTTIDASGGKIDVTYSNGSKETIDIDNAWCTGLDASKIGKQTITVTYAGLTTSFDINVYPLGDVNGDTSINAADALLDLQHSVQIITLPTERFRRGDVNVDNAVRADDALKILQYSVKIINEF